MKIYMSNIEHINNLVDLEKKLSESELIQYNKFNRTLRKKQYLLGHVIVRDVCNENIKTDINGAPKLNNGFVSIAHKDNWVIAAVSDTQVGIDIENTTTKRDFIGQSELLRLPQTENKYDFYKEFVRYESKLKFGKIDRKCYQHFFTMNNYIICITTHNNQDIAFFDYDNSFSDISGAFNFICAEQTE